MELPPGFYDLFNAIPAGLLIFARISGMIMIAPVLGGDYVPMTIRALLSLAITLLVAPVILPTVPMGGTLGPLYVGYLAAELATGLTMGFCFDCFFQAMRFGGDMVGRTAGFAAAETFNPLVGTTSGPTGDVFHIPLILLYLGMNGHHEMLFALTKSFMVVPLGGFTLGDGITAAVIEVTNQVFDLGMSLSFPVLAVIMAITVAEGVIARAVPQINILMISFATKIMGTLIVLLFGMPLVLVFMGTVLVMARDTLIEIIPLIGG